LCCFSQKQAKEKQPCYLRVIENKQKERTTINGKYSSAKGKKKKVETEAPLLSTSLPTPY
jgi:hypothetical protein